MQSLAQAKEAKGKFIERKFLNVLNQPFESSGTLLFQAPGHLEKHAPSPKVESLVLDQGVLTIDCKVRNIKRTPARRVFDVSLPLIAAVIVITACLMLVGHALTIFHLIGLLLAVTAGSNYALFFDHRCTSPQDRERTVNSLLFANASTVLGFGLLSFSQSPVLSAIGSTVAAGAVLSLIFSAILIVRSDE